jgi:transposase
MGLDRVDVHDLEKGPPRPQANRTAGQGRSTDVFNAILYVYLTGIPWKCLPHHFLNYGTVYAYFPAWRDERIFAQLNYDLTGLARAKEGTQALLRLARQRINVLFAMLRDSTSYEPRTPRLA